MNSLFVAWQSPPAHRWHTIGRLGLSGGRYRFDYTRGALHAAEYGFRPLSSFPDFHVTYESERLFPFFSNRLLSKNRAEYPEFIRWVSPHEVHDDPIALLAQSGGARMTDALVLYPEPSRSADGTYHMHFFVHGLSHMPAASAQRVERLSDGERLCIMKDIQNHADPHALMLRTDERSHGDVFFVGYVPRYFARILFTVLEESSGTEIFVVRVNPPPAPIQFRVLCCFSIRLPHLHSLFEGDEFATINRLQLPIANSEPPYTVSYGNRTKKLL